MVIPYGLGSGDHEARTFGRIMEKHLGVTMVPSNHEGALAPSASAIFFPSPRTDMPCPSCRRPSPSEWPRGTSSLRPPISSLPSAPSTPTISLAVEKDSPFKTLDDMVKFAKEKPGYMNVGGTNVNGAHHVFANLFFKDADIKAQYIPYNGSNQTLVALLGKNLDVMVTSPPQPSGARRCRRRHPHLCRKHFRPGERIP